MTVYNTAKRDVYRPTMRRELKEPGNKGTEVIMIDATGDDTPDPPDPPEELKFDQQPSNTGTAKVGKTLTGVMGTAKGGVKPYKPYVAKWRYRVGDDPWVDITEWSTDDPQEYVVRGYDSAHKINFYQKIEDAAGTVKQTGSIKTVEPPPALVVETPVVTGQPWVGETLTCSEPTVSGGVGPYAIDYFWVDEDNVTALDARMGPTTMVTTYDVGKMMYCLVMVKDNGWDGGESVTVDSNRIGPIDQRTIGNVVYSVDSTPVAINDTVPTRQGNSHVILMEIDGNAANPLYTFDVRQGQARLTPNGNTCIVIIESDPPMGVNIQCNVQDNNTVEQTTGQRLVFAVGE